MSRTDDLEALYDQANRLTNVLFYRMRHRIDPDRWTRLYRTAREREARRFEALMDARDAAETDRLIGAAEALWELERQ